MGRGAAGRSAPAIRARPPPGCSRRRGGPLRGGHHAPGAALEQQLVLGDHRGRHRGQVHHLATLGHPRQQHRSTTRCTPSSAPAPAARPDPGLSDNDRDTPPSPGCLPGLPTGLPPRSSAASRGSRCHGGSEDGGREEFDESAPSRRSSSATRAVNLSINSACTVTNSRSSASVESVSTNQYCPATLFNYHTRHAAIPRRTATTDSAGLVAHDTNDTNARVRLCRVCR